MATLIADDLNVCTDCAMLLANGELPHDEAERERYEKLLDLAESRGEFDNGHWVLTCDGEADHVEFSWRKCDLCRSKLGGSRCKAAIIR